MLFARYIKILYPLPVYPRATIVNLPYLLITDKVEKPLMEELIRNQ